MNGVALLAEELRHLRAERAALLERVNRLEHDRLSGLWRREPWEERAMRLLARRVRGGVVVVVLDLDRFKEVNDRLGHGAGDQVIAHAGRHLGDWAARHDGAAGRLGGDEFAAAVPVTARAAHTALSALHAALTAPVRLDTPDGPRRVTVGASIGATHTAHHPHVPLSALMRIGDEAMYEVKRAGGGVHVAGPGHQPHRTEGGRRAGRGQPAHRPSRRVDQLT